MYNESQQAKAIARAVNDHLDVKLASQIQASMQPLMSNVDMLVGMVTNIESQVADISKCVSRLTALTAVLEARSSNHFPSTFLIMPKPGPLKHNKRSKLSLAARAGNFINR